MSDFEEVWPRRKILGIFFAPHFGCSTTGNFRAKLQFRKRFAIAKPCFALQFPLENTSVETVTTRELVRSVGRRSTRASHETGIEGVAILRRERGARDLAVRDAGKYLGNARSSSVTSSRSIHQPAEKGVRARSVPSPILLDRA